MSANSLYYGDNLKILMEHIPDESVDLIYLDPPFNSKASYNVLFKERTGEGSAAQIKAFEDTWRWGEVRTRGTRAWSPGEWRFWERWCSMVIGRKLLSLLLATGLLLSAGLGCESG